MKDILERLGQYAPPDRVQDDDTSISVDIWDAAREIAHLRNEVERLNMVVNGEELENRRLHMKLHKASNRNYLIFASLETFGIVTGVWAMAIILYLVHILNV